MSASEINPTSRQQVLKQMIRKLHAGATVDEVKKESAALLSQGSGTEIAELEQALIAEGMPESEITRLCDVHMAVFKGSLATEAGG